MQLAVSMAGRAAALARELKNIKSELHFMQERCGLLEEENKRLREGYDNGVPPEEDDLVIMASCWPQFLICQTTWVSHPTISTA
jgi:hypothetical protein